MFETFLRFRHSFPRGCGIGVLLLISFASCKPAPQAGPIAQRGYVWQREWTPAVVDSLKMAADHLSGVVLLGAELRMTGSQSQAIRATIDWPAVKAAGVPVAIALRVAPTSSGFANQEQALHELARSLLAEARAAGIPVTEFQLDYDAPQKKLASYRAWLHRLRKALPGERLVITTLPAWLSEPEFAPLISEVDGYVLQVHSVPAKEPGGREVLCEPALARAWIHQAARLGRPFTLALPTYWCVAGYGTNGALLGVAMEGEQPVWPPDARTFELHADADQLAALVGELMKERPAQLREIIWYRVPVATDRRNWRWPTLAAVMAGRTPIHRLEARAEGKNPVDIVIVNTGEADESHAGIVTVTGPGSLASDALPGWSVEQQQTKVLFTPIKESQWRLSPGGKRHIGWIRYEKTTDVAVEITPPLPVRH